jgi:deferrochelatase/peroxidase EfeB
MAKPGPQAGILNRPPEHLLLATLVFAERQSAAARAALTSLSDLIETELSSQLDPAETETGELGFEDGYDRSHLTITLGISLAGYECLGVEAADRPQDLTPIPWSELVDAGQVPAVSSEGDLVLQICADSLYICEHVLRRVQHDLSAGLTVLATFIGSQRYSSRAGRTSRREGRALVGFLDGTSNLDPRNDEDDAALVFVDPTAVSGYPPNPPAEPPAERNPYGTAESAPGPHFPLDLAPPPASEPDWTAHGTYMTVRVSSFAASGWDARPQGEQQETIGRFKHSGAALDLGADDPSLLEAAPHFAADPTDKTVALTAHIRKANPRGQGTTDAERRIFRRGYPLIAGGGGDLQRGLIFISFARSISTQFEFVVRGWIRNPDFPEPGSGTDDLFSRLGETILGGGYYFVPPLAKKTEPWTWRLP